MTEVIDDLECAFCGASPRYIRDIYPESKGDEVTCSTWGCPANGTWVHRDVWNCRDDAALMEATARKHGLPKGAKR